MRVKFLFFILAFCGFCSHASVYLDGTRYFFKENEKEITIKVTNPGKSPVLIQSWIDDGDAKSDPDSTNTPFFLSPPISKINDSKSQTLRVSHNGTAMPRDRESVFWLNVLEIPQTKKTKNENQIQVAYRTRVKLFYRPSSLGGNSHEAAENLYWEINGNKLTAKNDSPFHVSLIGLQYKTTKGDVSVDADMISPFSSRDFEINLDENVEVAYSYVNDWGAFKSKKILLNGIGIK